MSDSLLRPATNAPTEPGPDASTLDKLRWRRSVQGGALAMARLRGDYEAERTALHWCHVLDADIDAAMARMLATDAQLLEGSSIGRGARAVATDLDAELSRLDCELTPGRHAAVARVEQRGAMSDYKLPPDLAELSRNMTAGYMRAQVAADGVGAVDEQAWEAYRASVAAQRKATAERVLKDCAGGTTLADAENAVAASNCFEQDDMVRIAEGFRDARLAERKRVLAVIESAGNGRPTVPWLHNVLLKLWSEP
jgi:hypothetical protein